MNKTCVSLFGIDGQGTHSTTDRLDVTLIEPSGQMLTATTGNQPQGGSGQQNSGTNDISNLLGPLMQQIATGVMNNLQGPGNPGELYPPNISGEVTLERLCGPQSVQHQHKTMEGGRGLLYCLCVGNRSADFLNVTNQLYTMDSVTCIDFVHGFHVGH